MPGPRTKKQHYRGTPRPQAAAATPGPPLRTASGVPAAPTLPSPTQGRGSASLCQTLDDEGITRCSLPATAGEPRQWCKTHHKQYVLMYKKYKAAAAHVDTVRAGHDMPTDKDIAEYANWKLAREKLKWVESYVKAIRVERTGRQLHTTRFFLKADSGHNTRINILAKEMENANRVRQKLGERVLELYSEEDPEAEWARKSESRKIRDQVLSQSTSEPTKAEEPPTGKTAAQDQGATTATGVGDSEEEIGGEDDDLIAMCHELEKRRICSVFEPFMDEELGRKFSREMYISRGGDPLEPDSDLVRYAGRLHYLALTQYARRIVFYDPILFAKSLDKVSFRDMVLSDDFNIEDVGRFMALYSQVDGLPLPWMKDSVHEALEIMKKMKGGPPEQVSAGLGKVEHRFKVLGGWVYNQRHAKPVTDEVWWHLLRIVGPQANTEHRYVRLCNTFEDLIGMLSIGALGQLPPPHFCQFRANPELTNIALASRQHLSLSGIIAADMSSPPQGINGPFLTTQPATRPGNKMWVEMEPRAYMFGAVQHGADASTEAFLDELRKRPDLFQLLLWSETEPDSSLKEWGSNNGKALPQVRVRKYEARMGFPPQPPPGQENWETARSAKDILFSTQKDKIIGYITNLRNEAPGWFFRFKKFPVRYFVVLSTSATEHAATLIRNVAWAALVAGKYGSGTYTDPKYHKASDKLFQEKAAQRLSWMDTNIFGPWSTTKMADSDEEDEIQAKGMQGSQGKRATEKETGSEPIAKAVAGKRKEDVQVETSEQTEEAKEEEEDPCVYQ